MKSIVGLILLAVISMASANLFANFHLMLEVQKNKDGVMKALSRDFSISRGMIIEAIQQTVEQIKIDDEINGFNTDTSNGTVCGVQLAELGSAAVNGELWALAVIDSYAKIQSGFGRGNIRNPGHFRQCIEVFHPLPESIFEPIQTGAFRGKHCVVAMRQLSGDFELPITIITPPPIINM